MLESIRVTGKCRAGSAPGLAGATRVRPAAFGEGRALRSPDSPDAEVTVDVGCARGALTLAPGAVLRAPLRAERRARTVPFPLSINTCCGI